MAREQGRSEKQLSLLSASRCDVTQLVQGVLINSLDLASMGLTPGGQQRSFCMTMSFNSFHFSTKDELEKEIEGKCFCPQEVICRNLISSVMAFGDGTCGR